MKMKNNDEIIKEILLLESTNMTNKLNGKPFDSDVNRRLTYLRGKLYKVSKTNII